MDEALKGGCLCGRLRYAARKPPLWVTVCYCRFCQHATGSDRMIEPIFERAAFAFTRGSPELFTLPSQGSGRDIHVHFCANCGTKLALTFARWDDRLGIYIGTLDDPARILLNRDSAKQIFVSEARPETVVLAHLPTYIRHATENDGTPIDPLFPNEPVRADAFLAQVSG